MRARLLERSPDKGRGLQVHTTTLSLYGIQHSTVSGDILFDIGVKLVR